MDSLISRLQYISKRKLVTFLGITAFLVFATSHYMQQMKADENPVPVNDTRVAVSGRVFDISTNKALSGVKITYSSTLPNTQPIIVNSETGTFNAMLPDEISYNRIILEKDGYTTAQGSFLFNSTTSQPKEITVNVGISPGDNTNPEIIHLQTFMPGENYFSLPVAPAEASPAKFLSYYTINPASNDGFIKKYIPTIGKLSKWNNTSKAFTQYNNSNRGMLFGNIQAMEGYKLVFDGEMPITVVFRGTLSTENLSTKIESAGLTYVGYPRNVPENLSNIRVTTDKGEVSLAQAFTDGIITDFRWHDSEIKEGAEQINPAQTFWPGRAFWVQTAQDNVIITFNNPLKISDIVNTPKDDNAYQITFNTNKPSFAKVAWGETDNYDHETPITTEPATNHSIDVAVPAEISNFHYRALVATSREALLGGPQGNSALSYGDETDGSDDAHYEPAPRFEIVDYSVKDISSTTATVAWTTNMDSSGRVMYKIVGEGDFSRIDSGLGQNHTINLSDLRPDTKYLVNIYAEHDNALPATDFTQFTTLKDININPRCEVTSRIEGGRWIPGEYKAEIKCATDSEVPATLLYKEARASVDFPPSREFSTVIDVVDDTDYVYMFIVNYQEEVEDSEKPIVRGEFKTPRLGITNVYHEQSPFAIQWTTNLSSSSRIDVNTESGVRTYSSKTKFGTEHGVTLLDLTGLKEKTEYNYTIRAQGKSEKDEILSGKFITPGLINRQSAYGSGETATFTIETTEPTNCTVAYSGPKEGSINFAGGKLWHTQTVYDMPNGTYNYNLKCTGTTSGLLGEAKGDIYLFKPYGFGRNWESIDSDTGNVTMTFNNPNYLTTKVHVEGYAKSYLGSFPNYITGEEFKTCRFTADQDFPPVISGTMSFTVPCSGASYSILTYAITSTGEYAGYSDYVSSSLRVGYPATSFNKFSLGATISYARKVAVPELRTIQVIGSYKNWLQVDGTHTLGCYGEHSPQDGGNWSSNSSQPFYCPGYWYINSGTFWVDNSSPSSSYSYKWPNSSINLSPDRKSVVTSEDGVGQPYKDKEYWIVAKTQRPFINSRGETQWRYVCFIDGNPTAEDCDREPPRVTY